MLSGHFIDHVVTELSPDVTITSSIINQAAEELAPKPSMTAFAMIKVSGTMVGI